MEIEGHRTVRRGAVAAVVFAATLLAVGCSGADDDSNGSADTGSGSNGNGTGVTGDVPEGADFSFELSGAFDGEVTAKGAGRNQRAGQTRLNFTGVTDGGENFSLLFTLEATEGTTGEVESTNVAQLTHGSVTYRTEEGVSVRLDTYSGGRLAGTVSASFGEKKTSSAGEYESISPPVKVEGAFDFEYD